MTELPWCRKARCSAVEFGGRTEAQVTSGRNLMADSIPVQCPACGASLSISQQVIGQTVTCPACRAAVVPVATSGMPIPVAYASATNAAPTSGMAIASLVLGCLFCIPLTGVLALIFGIIALKQTRERQASGRGMAIAGTVLGSLN